MHISPSCCYFQQVSFGLCSLEFKNSSAYHGSVHKVHKHSHAPSRLNMHQSRGRCISELHDNSLVISLCLVGSLQPASLLGHFSFLLVFVYTKAGRGGAGNRTCCTILVTLSPSSSFVYMSRMIFLFTSLIYLFLVPIQSLS